MRTARRVTLVVMPPSLRHVAAVLVTVAIGVTAAAPAYAVGGDVIGGPDLASTGVVVRPLVGATALPPVVAESWVLADLTTGEVLAAKAPHRLGRPASTLKTLTALALLPRLDRATVHTVTDKEARADGGHVGLVPGATYTLWDLWHGLLLPSGNDAAAALANANGGMAATAADMARVATTLQANDTTVRNASGLDADGQLTSAYDLALIARAAMANEDFRALTKAVSYNFPGKPVAEGATRSTYKIYTQNRLLLRRFPGAVGGKTGFTTLAKRTFWGAATRDGHTLAVTMLQIGQPTDTAAKALLTWGFANLGKVTPVGELVDPLPDVALPAPGSSAGGGQGTTASGGTPDSSSTGTGSGWLLWLLGALGIAGATYLALGRRTRSRPATTDHAPAAVAATVLPDAPVLPEDTGLTTPRRATARPAAARTSAVVVSTPGRRVEVTSATAAPDPRPAPASLDQEPVPVPVVVDAPATPRPRPRDGGNVRVIHPGG